MNDVETHTDALLESLATVPPIRRAELAGDLSKRLAEIRHQAIYEASLRAGQSAVAAQLGVSQQHISKTLRELPATIEDQRLMDQALLLIARVRLASAIETAGATLGRDVKVKARKVVEGCKLALTAKSPFSTSMQPGREMYNDEEIDLLERAKYRAEEILYGG
jgi:hypothetical protein